MATAISAWNVKLGGSILNCSDAMLQAATLSAIREFCRKTELWTVELTAISIVADTAEYALATTAGDVINTDHVEIDDEPITETSETYLDKNEYGWRDMESADPLRFYVNVDREIVLVYTPSASNASALAVWVNLMPLEAATTVEDFLWEDHWRVINYGAKSELFEMDAYPWGDLEKAEYFRQKFLEGIDYAAMFKESGYSGLEPTLRFEYNGE